VIGNGISAYVVSLILSSLGVFVFLVSAYYVLTNVDLTVRNVLPGAVLATVLLQVTFQALPLYVRFAKVNPALHTFGGTAILLVWLYVMSNVIVFGAELNWWRACQEEEQVGEEAVGLA
jgi:membrane protein